MGSAVGLPTTISSVTSTVNIYWQLLGELEQHIPFHNHQYADDTQLYGSFSPDPDTAAAKLKQCLAENGSWRQASWLQLNLDKTEVMIISRGKRFEDLVKFLTAPSIEGICLVHLSGAQFRCFTTHSSFSQNSYLPCWS